MFKQLNGNSSPNDVPTTAWIEPSKLLSVRNVSRIRQPGVPDCETLPPQTVRFIVSCEIPDTLACPPLFEFLQRLFTVEIFEPIMSVSQHRTTVCLAKGEDSRTPGESRRVQELLDVS